MPTGRTITFREAYGYDMRTLREMEEDREIVKRVTCAIYDKMDLMDRLDTTSAETYARAAIEAMRDLVKCTRNGARDDDVRLNQYIDAALGVRPLPTKG